MRGRADLAPGIGPKLTPGGKKESLGELSNTRGLPVAPAVASAICLTTKSVSIRLSKTARVAVTASKMPTVQSRKRFIGQYLQSVPVHRACRLLPCMSSCAASWGGRGA